MRKRTYIMGIVSGLMLLLGTLLKANHSPGASESLSIGTMIFVLGFSVSYLFDKLSRESKLKIKIAHVIQYLAMFMLVFSALFHLQNFPGSAPMSVLAMVFLVIYFIFFSRHTEGRKLIMQKDRQLASILFTDIVGFTRMMGEDEDKTLLALDRNRLIQKKHIRKYRGRWIKEMGDGAMALFYTVSEAIQCAIDIQQEVNENEDFKLSMGIHVSEILFTEKDVFGDGVNVAARIAAMAGANEICFSSIVYQNIRNRENIKIESLGNQELKNVNYGVDIYKIVV